MRRTPEGGRRRSLSLWWLHSCWVSCWPSSSTTYRPRAQRRLAGRRSREHVQDEGRGFGHPGFILLSPAPRATTSMKGIVLAGGTGSRLSPLTAVTNKHLLPVGNYPMVFHPIARLKQAGIRDILVVTGREHMGDVMELLGSGHDFELDLTYKAWDQAGCLAQVNASSLDHTTGDDLVQDLMDRGMVACTATDAHDTARRPPEML